MGVGSSYRRVSGKGTKRFMRFPEKQDYPLTVETLKEFLLEPAILYIESLNGINGERRADYHQYLSNFIYDFLQPPNTKNKNWNHHWLYDCRGSNIHTSNYMLDITDFLDESIGLPLHRKLKHFEVKLYARKLVNALIQSLEKFRENL